MAAKAKEAGRMRLGTNSVKALAVREADYVVWDDDLTGFGVRVWPSGKKVFIAFYRFNGDMRKVTLGQFGKLTVDQARTAAKETLSKATLGSDVAAEKARARAEMTVSELCDLYMREGVEHKKASTLAVDKGRIARHIKPLLGTKKIGAVGKADISKFISDVAKGKTKADVKTAKHGRARVRGGKGTATRTVRLLGGIFTFAVDRGYIATNPRVGVKLYADGAKERFLSPEELAKLGEALRIAETDGLPTQRGGRTGGYRPFKAQTTKEKLSPHAVAAIRLLILTGCRLSEILTLKWGYVDFRNGLLNLPDSKTGAKKVLLSAPALQVLAAVPRIKDCEYVIAGGDPEKPRSDLKRPWERITAHAGLDGLRIHDLRHSFASVGAAAGMGLPVVGKLLGHASPTTTQKYAHFGDDPLRRASDQIAGVIAAQLDGKPAAKPTPMRAAR